MVLLRSGTDTTSARKVEEEEVSPATPRSPPQRGEYLYAIIGIGETLKNLPYYAHFYLGLIGTWNHHHDLLCPRCCAEIKSRSGVTVYSLDHALSDEQKDVAEKKMFACGNPGCGSAFESYEWISETHLLHSAWVQTADDYVAMADNYWATYGTPPPRQQRARICPGAPRKQLKF